MTPGGKTKVKRGNLLLATPERSIFEYAAPLYRIALPCFLPLPYPVAMPSSRDAAAFGAYIADHMEFMGPQKDAEESLLTATRPPEERGRRRPRVMRPAP